MSGSANPYIGSNMSLVSKAEIRYEGLLHEIDTKKSTVTLKNVRSFGTEGRNPENEIPSKDEIFQFIIFRGSDIKDISVSEPKYVDPAIVQSGPITSQASAPSPAGFSNVPFGAPPTYSSNLSSPGQSYGKFTASNSTSSVANQLSDTMVPSTESHENASSIDRQPPRKEFNKNKDMRPRPQQNINRFQQRDYSYQRRDFYDKSQGFGFQAPNRPSARMNSGNYNYTQQPRQRQQRMYQSSEGASQYREKTNYDEEFDIEDANAKFDKSELLKEFGELTVHDAPEEGFEDGEIPPDDNEKKFYDKKKSFFDNISCDSQEKRNSRLSPSEERKMNAETFGVSSVYRNRNNRGRFQRPTSNRGGNYYGGYNGPNQRRYNYNYNAYNSQYVANSYNRGGSRGGFRDHRPTSLGVQA